MAGWAGFSDEELRKLQQKDQGVPAALGRGRKPTSTNRSRQQLQREKALHTAAQQKVGSELPVLPPEQQLSKPPPKTVPETAAPVAEKVQEINMNVNRVPASAEDFPPTAKELETPEVELREKTRLEQLQLEQKVMEEKNRRKKALLAKTIAEKSKQTHAEAVKLNRIQKELQTLDDMVSNDIGILRGKIEQASWDYSLARKRYEKAEAEYVTAKLDLHKKTEVKEQLTEHLCAIIQQNELRKAHKLEELMQQLQLQATEEELEKGRETEHGEEKRRSGQDKPGEVKVEKGVQENGETTLHSSQNCGPTEEGMTKCEEGTTIHQNSPPAMETKMTDRDCEVIENCVQRESLASVS
ncbi:RAB6-interacting golgin [Lampris incognitus]|uniref:RAB6-interacting golgin n=1 Tax=Lampris incognitus TaxID=2546036 RepID=UPI0024B4B74F|nr:RAB6-interacting golgin [Lampris incognitus]